MSRQGSASFTIVIGAGAAIVVGAIMLTFMHYPVVGGLMGGAFMSSESAAGTRVITYTKGLWTFWGAIILIGILSFVWVSTRQ